MLAFAIISFASSLLAIGFVFLEGKRLLAKSFRHELQGIVTVASDFMDGEEISQIRQREDEGLPVYQKYQTLLNSLQKGLTAEGLQISHFYTVHKLANAPGELFFGLNTADDPHQVLPPGLSYLAENKEDIQKNFGTVFSSKKTYHGTFGKWFSAFAPIFNGNDQVVAMLGIDVSAQLYLKEINRLFYTHFFALFVSLLASMILAYLFSRTVTRSLMKLMEIVEYIGHGHYDVHVSHKMDGEFSRLAGEISEIGKALSARSIIEENFSSYVSYPVLQSLLRSPPPLKGEKRTITALFGDLRSFTKMTESHPVDEVIDILNIFFETMFDTTFKFKGTLENFRGDGFLILFGAPMHDPQHQEHAVEAALAMIKTWEILQKREREPMWPSLPLNIGIHTGSALIGGIGEKEHLHYTAIGDTVHIAQQIASEASKQKLPLIISKETREAQKQMVETEKLPDLPLPDQKASISIYTVKIQE